MIYTVFPFYLIFINIVKAIELCTNSTPIKTWRLTNSEYINPNGNQLYVFCYAPEYGFKPSITKVWTSVMFHIIPEGDFTFYRGQNATDICSQHISDNLLWFNKKVDFWKVEKFSVRPFDKACIGILSGYNFKLNLYVKDLDYKIAFSLFIGIVLFVSANKLSRHVLFYYGSGISLGILASVLIAAFIVGRYMPKKNLFYSIILAAASLSAYIYNYICQNIINLLQNYYYFVAAYLLTTGLISFCVCYYKGPVSNPKLITLIKWTIQLLAIFLIYYGSQILEFSLSVIVILILSSLFKINLPYYKYFYMIWLRRFPLKIKLLTEDEYYLQASIETKKALDQLKDYCKSPKCDTWKTVSRLNSPNQFAQWIDGSRNHLSDVEIMEHDISACKLPKNYYELNESSVSNGDYHQEALKSNFNPSRSHLISPVDNNLRNNVSFKDIFVNTQNSLQNNNSLERSKFKHYRNNNIFNN